MRKYWTLLAMLSLTACADPLANFERIEDVELATDGSVAQALPDADDVSPMTGLFSRLLGRASTLTATDAEADAIAAIVADETSVDDTPVAEVAEPVGLRGWMQKAVAPELENKAEPVENAVTEVASEDLVEPTKRLGLFGGLWPAKAEPATVKTASLQPDSVVPPNPSALIEPKKRSGLFGDLTREKQRKGPDAQDVEYGTLLPFGQVARVCGANKTKLLGRRLEKVPFHGRGYALYDSSPDSVGPRTFYVTGFKDNCPRQFSAALAMFGSPLVHEQLRYGRPSKEYPYSTTDQAYEKVKKSVCKVGKSKPCGSAMVVLQNNTVFISTYEKFTDNARWADILIHDGTVLAAAIKAP